MSPDAPALQYIDPDHIGRTETAILSMMVRHAKDDPDYIGVICIRSEWAQGMSDILKERGVLKHASSNDGSIEVSTSPSYDLRGGRYCVAWLCHPPQDSIDEWRQAAYAAAQLVVETQDMSERAVGGSHGRITGSEFDAC